MKIKSLFLFSFTVVVICVTVVSCKNKIDDECLLSEKAITTDIDVRSDLKGSSDLNSFDVSQAMVELYIKADKNNSKIVSIEPYTLDGTTCFYIINFVQGFKIISADTRIQPILAQSDKDNLYLSGLNDRGVISWLEDTADKIRILKIKNPATGEDFSDLWSNFIPEESHAPQTRSLDPNQEYIWIKVVDLSSQPYSYYVNVNHLMTTDWGQGSPWNSSMPYDRTYHNDLCLAGCASVAVGQVLYYFHNLNNTPNDLWHNISISSTSAYGNYWTVSLSKSGYTSNSSHWSQMPLNSVGSYTSYVSDLLLDLGVRLNTYYSKENSYVSEGNDYSIQNLNQCGLSSSFSSFDYSTVKNNISIGKPVIVKSLSSSLGWIASGHIWVIDGCKDYLNQLTTTTTYYYIPIEYFEYYSEMYNIVASYSNEDMLSLFPGAYNGMQSSSISYEHLSFIKMNWGMDGFGKNTDYGVTDTASWIDQFNHDFLYQRYIHYNISTSQLN